MTKLNKFLKESLNEEVHREEVKIGQFENDTSNLRAKGIIKHLKRITGSSVFKAFQYENGNNTLELILKNGIVFTKSDFLVLNKIGFEYITIEKDGKTLIVNI